MRLFRKKADRFKTISLAYRAPVLPEIFTKLDSPPVFYNAFPDFNDQAMDGSYSAYPKGAKYLLPLACTFNPYGTFKWVDDTDPLTTLPGYERLKEEYSPDSPLRYEMFPKAFDPALEHEFALSEIFEKTHRRLAAAAYKQMFRANLLGPFHETLYDFILTGEKIRVPLVPAQKGSKLQRQWDQITEWLSGTTVLDEACSLLVTLAFFQDKEVRDILESFWVMAEDKVMQGKFIPFFDRFRLSTERAYGGCLDSCVTENELLTFAEVAISIANRIYNAMACNGISNAADFFKPDADSPYPDDEEVVNTFSEQFPNLYETMRFGKLPVALGAQLYVDECKLSFTDELKFGPEVLESVKTDMLTGFKNHDRRRRFPIEYFFCQTEILKNGTTSLRITQTGDLENLMEFLYSVNADDLDDSNRAKHTLFLTIFIESMRQQICQGVGLRCPFWDGECCRSDFRALLARVNAKTKPWKWQHHWQLPPCLV